MIRAIINADDFGISEEVNFAIAECFQRKLISNTTIMTNMPFSYDAVKIAIEHGFWDKVGLHLNLREGKPMTEKIRKESLFCDSNGLFSMSIPKWQRYFMSCKRLKDETYDALCEEIHAQMSWYENVGGIQKHMDSHQAIHTWYMLYSAIKPIYDSYNFKSMRKRVIGYTDSGPQKIYRRWINGMIPGKVDYFYDGKTFVERVKTLETDKTYEIMCHPIYDNNQIIDTVSGIRIDRIISCGDIHLFSY